MINVKYLLQIVSKVKKCDGSKEGAGILGKHNTLLTLLPSNYSTDMHLCAKYFTYHIYPYKCPLPFFMGKRWPNATQNDFKTLKFYIFGHILSYKNQF